MTADAEKLLAEALNLPTKLRAEIAGRLLRSLDEEEADDPAEVEGAWAAEIDRRDRELESGAVKGMTLEEVKRFILSDDPDEAR